jgi:hypothetical protein
LAARSTVTGASPAQLPRSAGTTFRLRVGDRAIPEPEDTDPA